MTAILRMVLGLAVLAQWLGFAFRALRSGEKFPSSGLRRADRNLIFSSALSIVCWFFVSDGLTLFGPRATIAESSLVQAGRGSGTCASVEAGMNEAKVRELMGPADEVRSAEDLRGPGAVTWRYDSSRCVIHIVDGKVEFIE